MFDVLRVMRRNLSIIVVVIGLATGLAACGSSSKSGPANQPGVTTNGGTPATSGTPTTAGSPSGGGGYGYG